MLLTSPEFENNKMIPERNTGFGEDLSPELILVDIPESNRTALKKAMAGHILAEAELIGIYDPK